MDRGPSFPNSGRLQPYQSTCVNEANLQRPLSTVAAMDRRQALRAATALTIGVVAAGCDAPKSAPAPLSATSSPATGAAPETSPPPDEIRYGPRTRPNVALTFHGQGDPILVHRLLDELARAGVKVTVLAVGTWLAASPQLAQRVLADGHDLGNHTQHHADIKRMTPAQAQAEIAECADALTAVCGSIGRWFRPSQTRYATARIKAAAARVGYHSCLSYDVDSRDYTNPGPAAVVANTMKAVQPGSIVSLHFGHAGTISAITPLIAGLHERGLEPVTMTELMA
jgi:peptidoglycan/xylan/chitin deacetylase (PgdA/CDA1 family)